MTFPGLQHIAITVSDLERSTRWYTALFGAEPVLDEDEEGGRFHHTVFALDGGMLFGLHTHQGRESGEPANEERTGLGHISFAVGSTAELTVGVEAERDRHRARRGEEGALRQRRLLPRPGQHSPGVLRVPRLRCR